MLREIHLAVVMLLGADRLVEADGRKFASFRCERGSVMVKALCYKPAGRGFDTDEAIF
jgi:hypothetical protein